MHVHANYSLQLATLGASRDEIHQMESRRSAAVRRKLCIAAGAMSEAEDAACAVAPRFEDPQSEQQEEPDSDAFGRLLSVRA